MTAPMSAAAAEADRIKLTRWLVQMEQASEPLIPTPQPPRPLPWAEDWTPELQHRAFAAERDAA